MKHLQEYITESVNVYNRMSEMYITESEFVEHNLSAINSVLFKMNKYNSDILNNRIDESYDAELTLDEQCAARDLLTYICNEYISSLTINEGLGDNLKKIYNTGKEKIQAGIDAAAIKIKQINVFLSELKDKAITSIKDLIAKITDMMLALKTSIEDLCNTLKLGDSAKDDFKKAVEDALKDEAILKAEPFEGTGELVWKAMKPVLLQMLASYVTSIIIPALIVVIGGPAAIPVANAVRVISEGFWGCTILWGLIKSEITYHKKGIYKELKTWAKALHCAFFLFVLLYCFATIDSAINDIIELLTKGIGAICKSFGESTVSGVVNFINEIIGSVKKSKSPNWDSVSKVVWDEGGKTLSKSCAKTFSKFSNDESTLTQIFKAIIPVVD